mmetsp:Transcript_67900/g.191399  ORF Transcript_67900/g.191399 Transcript_67900/m.191399 type:complete len:134 (-) Transcript_67900:730-1131(-)
MSVELREPLLASLAVQYVHMLSRIGTPSSCFAPRGLAYGAVPTCGLPTNSPPSPATRDACDLFRLGTHQGVLKTACRGPRSAAPADERRRPPELGGCDSSCTAGPDACCSSKWAGTVNSRDRKSLQSMSWHFW